jgi:hypothetical protein
VRRGRWPPRWPAAPAAGRGVRPLQPDRLRQGRGPRTTNVCEDCQREAGEARHRVWADDIVFGKPFGTRELRRHAVPALPGLQAEHRPRLAGLRAAVQRWRDGKVDLDGWLYERNVGVAHEDWGRLTVGAMTTRGWSAADYPSSFNAISSDFWGGGGGGGSTAWSDSGAAYGLLSRAVRYMSRPVEVGNGDVLFEATYDMGKSGWERNKPQFLELYAKYIGASCWSTWSCSRPRTASRWPGARRPSAA